MDQAASSPCAPRPINSIIRQSPGKCVNDSHEVIVPLVGKAHAVIVPLVGKEIVNVKMSKSLHQYFLAVEDVDTGSQPLLPSAVLHLCGRQHLAPEDVIDAAVCW